MYDDVRVKSYLAMNLLRINLSVHLNKQKNAMMKATAAISCLSPLSTSSVYR